ncbi:hypothetical protein AYO40_06530 [Planctomycetaceae bacterium SCGC AG-212-D15]|nr:hypothetical protein AYO40_06530 [Planctomycetaceae bacterium SCGC AG-212-D15]
MYCGMFCALALALPAMPPTISGQYVEARTCDIWTGPCFANAEMNLSGKHALMAWRVDKGTLDSVCLDGLGVVAVISARDTLGMKQSGPAKALLIVDARADKAQRDALVRLAQKQGGLLTKHVIGVQYAPIDLTICDCKDGGCARLKAGSIASIETRCIHAKHDKACGNESAFYPPLASGVKAKPAIAIQHGFSGEGIEETWTESDRRGAYLGSFQLR